MAKASFDVSSFLSFAALSNTKVLNIPKQISAIMLSKVHEAIQEPAIPFSLPQPRSFQCRSYGTTIAAATVATE